MRTWSLEEAVIRAQSALAVAVQGVWDGLVGLERVTRPRLGHDLDVVDGAEQLAEREESEEVWEPPELQADIRAFTISSVFEWMRQNRRTDVVVQCGHCLETVGDCKAFAVHMLTCELEPPKDSAQVVSRNEHPAETPAGVDTSFPPEVPPAGPQLDWHGWAEPAVMEVLAEHRPAVQRDTGLIFCPDGAETAQYYDGWEEWREHVAPLIASRLACDPVRAIAALHNHKPK